MVSWHSFAIRQVRKEGQNRDSIGNREHYHDVQSRKDVFSDYFYWQNCFLEHVYLFGENFVIGCTPLNEEACIILNIGMEVLVFSLDNCRILSGSFGDKGIALLVVVR